MDVLPQQRVLSLARECSELSAEQRRERLDRECVGDDGLREEIEAAIRQLRSSQKTDIYSNDYEKAIPDHYRLVELIGRGGMAEVFRAEDTRLSRSVAIKFLNSEFRKDPERMRRFNQEARAVSALNHPNIIVIHDVGENEGVQYIVTEFVDGETLNSRVSRGTVPLRDAVDIAIQVASALAASHKAGIVHRDIKPDNVMIRRDGMVKVLDFGLAKESIDFGSTAVDATAQTLDKALTSPGLILGTPQYMSPEQARGKQLDARTDIFSLGIIIFEMTAGKPPFGGGSLVDVIAAIISKDTPKLEDHVANPPASLSRIVDKSLRKNANERYETMDQLLADLRDAQRELAGSEFDANVTAGSQVRRTLHNTIETTPVKFRYWNHIFAGLGLIAAVGVAWWYIASVSFNPGESPATMRTVAITSWSSESGELSSSASFSPDGRMIAFGSTRAGATEIWLKPTVGGDAIQITRNGSFNQYPVWSPSGQEIAFFSKRGESSGIWRTSFTGGEQVEIAGGVGDPARPVQWGKTGKIYFQDGWELFAIEEKSGQKSKITDFESKGVRPRRIEISPDEKSVVYSISEGNLYKVRTMPLDSGAATDIATSKDQIDSLAWQPDGKSVIFSMSVDGAFQLFEAGPGIKEPRQLSNGNVDFQVQDVAADGSKILYGSVNETSDIWKVNVDDGAETVIASEVAAEYWPDISPDGKSVAFQSVKQVERAFGGSINFANVDQPSSARVIAQSGFSPVWSPDGQWIAFFRRTDDQIGLSRVRPGGDEATKIVDSGVRPPLYVATPYLRVCADQISWSPDSQKLAYPATTEGVTNIWVAKMDSAAPAPATRNSEKSEYYSCPMWSADGQSLIFVSESPAAGAKKPLYQVRVADLNSGNDRTVFESGWRFRILGVKSGGKELLIAQRSETNRLPLVAEEVSLHSIALDTGIQRKLTVLSDTYLNNIQLSRDGSTLAFVSRRDNTTALWTVPVDGSTPKRILVENDPKVLFSSLSWSRDGRTIVFGKQTRTNLISMLTK